jgi:hypothetical protein
MGPGDIRGWSVLILCTISLLLIDSLAEGGEAPAVEWSRHYPYLNFGEGVGTPLQETSDGGFVLSSIGIMKTNRFGGVLWVTTIPDPFLSGQAPSSPGPYHRGPDPTPDQLSCRSPGSCEGAGG